MKPEYAWNEELGAHMVIDADTGGAIVAVDGDFNPFHKGFRDQLAQFAGPDVAMALIRGVTLCPASESPTKEPTSPALTNPPI